MTEPVAVENSLETYAIRTIICIVTSICLFLFWKKLRDAHIHNKYKNKGMFGKPNDEKTNGLKRLTMDEYREQMRIATDKEKAKLFSSPEYKAAVEKKGWGQAAWNWQIRETEEKMQRQRLNNTIQPCIVRFRSEQVPEKSRLSCKLQD